MLFVVPEIPAEVVAHDARGDGGHRDPNRVHEAVSGTSLVPDPVQLMFG